MSICITAEYTHQPIAAITHVYLHHRRLIFKFCTCFIKKILLAQKKIKLWNERYYVGNKTDFAACLNNAVNFIVV
jgi:hypothetical protein